MKNLTFVCCAVLMSHLIFGCTHSTEFEDGEFAAGTPEEVAANLSRAYQETKLDGYLSLFSEDCRFLYGGEYMWGKTQEQKIHQRMFAAAKSIELKLTEALNEEATETARRSIYSYYLQIELRHEETLAAQGMVALELAKGPKGIWQIISFGELNTGVEKPAPTTSKTNAINSDVDYFPLRVGNQWIYEEQLAPYTNEVEVLVTDSVMIKSDLYYQAEPFGWDLFPISASFARQDSLHQLRLFVEDDSTERVIFNLGSEIGDSLTFIPPYSPEEMVVELISHKDSLTVPAGTFKDVLEFMITDNNSGSRYRYEFAANVGFVRQRGTNQVMALKSAFVNGRKYPVVVSVGTRYFDWTQIKLSFH